MNRDLFAKRLCKIIGRRNYSRLQQRLKFFLTFRKEYSFAAEKKHVKVDIPTIIFNVDGKTAHGGLSDRLRGAFATYHYAKSNNLGFRILWNSPFNLSDYLEPNSVDWEISSDEKSKNLSECAFRFFNSYCYIDNDEKSFFKLLKTPNYKKEIHVYCNTTIREDLYAVYFKELFRPSALLRKALDEQLKGIKEYVSVSFRFIGLLGDFKDQDSNRKELSSEKEKNDYIERSLYALTVIHQKFPGKAILVTSDSKIFLERAIALPFVYVVPGDIGHLDTTVASTDTDLKTFLDFMMIVNAEQSFCYTTGRMYGATRFAKTASLIGGHSFEVIDDQTLEQWENCE